MGYELPPRDKELVIGKSRFTRRQINEGYNPDADDKIVRDTLNFGRSVRDSQSAGVLGFIFDDPQMTLLELAAIIYLDKLPEEHPIKKVHNESDVREYIESARLAHYGIMGAPYA